MESEGKLKEMQKIIDSYLKGNQKPLIDWMVKDCTDMIRSVRADIDINWYDPQRPLPIKNQECVMGKFQGISVLSEKDLQKLYILKCDLSDDELERRKICERLLFDREDEGSEG